MSYGLLKGCGCFYGACICSSPPEVPQSVKLKRELNQFHARFCKMEAENEVLKNKVEKFERLAEKQYETIIDKAYRDSKKIINEATRESKKITDTAEEKASLYNELANGIRRAKTKAEFWEWFLKILPEVDEREMVEIIKDELKYRYKLEI